jgi:hypothetical protein
MNRHITPVAFLFALLASGCGGLPQPVLHPVTGTVTLAGKPATGGGLIFLPESGTWNAQVINGSVNADGTFTVTTSWLVNGKTQLAPGAPTGRYKVTYHPPGNGEKIGAETELPEVVTVEAKENVLKLDVPEGRSVRELKGEAAKKAAAAPTTPEPEKK